MLVGLSLYHKIQKTGFKAKNQPLPELSPEAKEFYQIAKQRDKEGRLDRFVSEEYTKLFMKYKGNERYKAVEIIAAAGQHAKKDGYTLLAGTLNATVAMEKCVNYEINKVKVRKLR